MTQYIIRDHARGRDCYWSGERWGPLSTALVIEDEGHTIYPIGDLGDTAEYETLPAAAGSHRFATVAAAGVLIGRLQIETGADDLGRLVAEDARDKLLLDQPEDFNAEQIADGADMGHEQMMRVIHLTTTLRLHYCMNTNGSTKITNLITPERPAADLLAVLGSEMGVDTSGIDLSTVSDIEELADLLEDAPKA